MNKEPDGRYIHFNMGPDVRHLMPALTQMGDLTLEERRERRIRLIEEADHEITLIRQEAGKLPESSLDKRIEDLLSIWRIRLKIGDDESAGNTHEERLKYLEQHLKHHRDDLNKMKIRDAEKPDETRNKPCLWLLLLAGVWCIVLALVDFREVWIYDLSRWMLFGIGAYTGFQFWKDGVRRFPIVLGIMAVIFNPFAPIRFGDAWNVVDALAGATFLGIYLWVSDWVKTAWKHRETIGFYAMMIGVVCFFLLVFAVAYFNSLNEGPERRAEELKVKREKALAESREALTKSLMDDDRFQEIRDKIFADREPRSSQIGKLPPEYEPDFQDSWEVIDSEGANGYDASWYPGKNW